MMGFLRQFHSRSAFHAGEVGVKIWELLFHQDGCRRESRKLWKYALVSSYATNDMAAESKGSTLPGLGQNSEPVAYIPST
jgi:hypothetical protein